MKEIERCQKDPTKLVNPKSGRCVLEHSPIIKKLISEGYTVVVTPKSDVPTPPKNTKVFKICPTDSSKLINPLTGRCVKQNNVTVKKLMLEGWTIAISGKSPGPLLIKPKKTLDYQKMIDKLDKNKDGIIVINEYLSNKEISIKEESQKKGLFLGIYDPTNIYKFLSIQKMTDPILDKNLCLYNTISHIMYNPKKSNIPETVISKRLNLYDYAKSVAINGIWLFNVNLFLNKKNQNLEIFIDPTFKDFIGNCKERFLIVPLVLSDATFKIYSTVRQDAHQNILIFDNEKKTIDRFDPHGKANGISWGHLWMSDPIFNNEKIDVFLKRYFNNLLPRYNYIDLEISCPYLGPQSKADRSDGYCVTWSLMFILMRLLNPDVPIQDLIKAMLQGTRQELVTKLGKFAKFYTDKLKKKATL